MRQVTKKGLITVAAAGGVLAMTGGYAHADSAADGSVSNSPGVLSGNSIQAPVNVPVNVCGNTVDVIGLLNPAFGNKCVNASSATPGPGKSHTGNQNAGGQNAGGQNQGSGHHRTPAHGTSGHGGGATAVGHTSGSPGVLSGNSVQLPVDVPVNACGNSVSVVGLLNPAFGNDCANHESVAPPVGVPHHPTEPGTPRGHGPHTPPKPATPHAPVTQTVSVPEGPAQLAHTGSAPLGLIIPASAGMMLGGIILYRRSRAAA
ncbi:MULTISPECIES: chaplin [unclassified Streptomyces]|uniref:chaplin n=1 Tax=unclassified Streptomyces TaxID=2593676 RepID=UPI00202571DA|nr:MULTISPECIES: chaplin family protein [unclassified Streptomyces]